MVAAAVPLALQAMQLMAAHRSSENQHKAGARRSELAAHITQMRIAVDREKIDAQKTILLAMITAAEGVFNRKMDAYAAGFEAVRTHVDARRVSLEEELKEVRRLRREGDADDRVSARARIGDIDEELEGLDNFLAKAKVDHDRIVHSTSLDIGFQPISNPLLPQR